MLSGSNPQPPPPSPRNEMTARPPSARRFPPRVYRSFVRVTRRPLSAAR